MEAVIGCFNLQERLLPALRAETARRLAEKGVRQGRIAEHLSVSQAMVSKYLRRPPKLPGGIPRTALHELAGHAVDRILEAERKGTLPPWCALCAGISEAVGGAQIAGVVQARECLRGGELPGAEESAYVLENVRQAERRLRGADILRLAPEVRINIAMALPNAKDGRGVAAFPGRLVELDGELRAVSDPEFGASNHLADLLLRVRKSHREVRAVLCLRDGEDVRRATRGADLRFRLLKRVHRELLVALPGEEALDAVVDPGDFGIEPITYVLSDSAFSCVEKAERILAQLRPHVEAR